MHERMLQAVQWKVFAIALLLAVIVSCDGGDYGRELGSGPAEGPEAVEAVEATDALAKEVFDCVSDEHEVVVVQDGDVIGRLSGEQWNVEPGESIPAPPAEWESFSPDPNGGKVTYYCKED
jgi:hypothetical protein